MSTKTYLNFDLTIESTGSDTMNSVVTASPVGRYRSRFERPFTDRELVAFLDDIGRTRLTHRRFGSPGIDAAREFGGKLFDAAFSGEVGGAFDRSLDEARRNGKGLRIRLRTEEAPSLLDVPWEFLYSEQLYRFLVVSKETPLVRYLEQRRVLSPLLVGEPLKILIVVAVPSDKPSLDADEEWNRVTASLQQLVDSGLVDVVPLPVATIGELQRQLRKANYHVFHFIGHGVVDAEGDHGALVFEGDDGTSREISGERLGSILHDHDSMRLVVLNSCDGARSARHDPFAGAAQVLVRQGIPAVIGMQFEITDTAAVMLSSIFYSAVADGYPVDMALAEARQAIFAEGNEVEWATPVLYMTPPDGMIFNVDHPSVARAIEPLREPVASGGRESPGERAARLNEEAAALAKVGDHAAALEQLDDSLNLYRQLATHAPSEYLTELAIVLVNKANVLMGQVLAGHYRLEEALPAVDEALDAFGGVTDVESRLQVAELLANKAALMGHEGRDGDALDVLEEAIVAQRYLMPDEPGVAIRMLTHSFFNRTTLLELRGRDDDALTSAEEALHELLPYYRSRPDMMNKPFVQLVLSYVQVSRREGKPMSPDIASAARDAGFI